MKFSLCIFITQIYVTGFGKICIVYTSDFAHSENYKTHREWYNNLKLSGMLKG